MQEFDAGQRVELTNVNKINTSFLFKKGGCGGELIVKSYSDEGAYAILCRHNIARYAFTIFIFFQLQHVLVIYPLI